MMDIIETVGLIAASEFLRPSVLTGCLALYWIPQRQKWAKTIGQIIYVWLVAFLRSVLRSPDNAHPTASPFNIFI